MASIVFCDPLCCSCLFASTSPNTNVIILPSEGDFELFASEMAATVAGENVLIEGALFIEYPECSMEMGTIHGKFKMPASDQNPLLGMQAAMVGALQIRKLGRQFYGFSGNVTVEASPGHHHHRFVLGAFGVVTLDFTNSSSGPFDFAATVELDVSFSSAGLVDEPEARPSAHSQPESQPSSVPKQELPANERETLTRPGKRKRSSVEDGVHCVMCLDSLDAILDHGQTLHAARCSHLFCSQCILGLNGEEHSCRRCSKIIVGVRRLYGV